MTSTTDHTTYDPERTLVETALQALSDWDLDTVTGGERAEEIVGLAEELVAELEGEITPAFANGMVRLAALHLAFSRSSGPEVDANAELDDIEEDRMVVLGAGRWLLDPTASLRSTGTWDSTEQPPVDALRDLLDRLAIMGPSGVPVVRTVRGAALAVATASP